jgi:CubicO group peptidase (beta-lactamase class C family)
MGAAGMKSIHQKYLRLSKVILQLTITFISLNSFAASDSMTILSSESPPSWRQLGLMEGFPPSKNKLVTRRNFNLAPYNRWAYQHTRYLFFTAPIERGTTGITQFETKPQDLMNKKFNINKHSQSLLSLVKQSYTDSLIVLYKGNIVTEYYDDGMTSLTPHTLASMTKSFTGTLAELMIYRGLLDPNKMISSYLPELQTSAYGDVTVQQLLDMEVGMPGDKDLRKSDYLTQFNKVIGWIPSSEYPSMYDVLPQAKSIAPNGKKFVYSSPNAEVAGWLLSRIANKPYEILLSQEIWSKLGTSGEAYGQVDSKAKMLSTGGLNLTTRDTARFAELIANNGKFNKQQILPTEVIKSITGGGNKLTWKNGEYWEMSPYINSYHSYWYQTDNKYHAVMAMGSGGQHIYIDPVNDVVIVKFASDPNAYTTYDDDWVSVYPQIVEALVNGK